VQHAIVAEIGAEQPLFAANRKLIARFEQRIQATLARIRGEAAPAAARALAVEETSRLAQYMPVTQSSTDVAHGPQFVACVLQSPTSIASGLRG